MNATAQITASPSRSAYQVEQHAEPPQADLEFLIHKIREADESIVGPPKDENLWLFLRHETDGIVGGAYAEMYYGWMNLRILWVDERHRLNGLGRDLLAQTEGEAVRRGCHSAWLDTFNPKAVEFYRKLGWSEFASLPDYPPGHARVFLRRQLQPFG